jgi:hypothetical protein
MLEHPKLKVFHQQVSQDRLRNDPFWTDYVMLYEVKMH